jgi:hypothetical protein
MRAAQQGPQKLKMPQWFLKKTLLLRLNECLTSFVLCAQV